MPHGTLRGPRPRERRYIIYSAFGGWHRRVIMRLMSRNFVYLADAHSKWKRSHRR